MNDEYKHLEADFVKFAETRDCVGIKGHRSVGGFRASMKTWMTEGSHGSAEIQENIMSHQFGNTVSRRYTHTELIEQRAIIMERWANFVTKNETNNVVGFRHG